MTDAQWPATGGEQDGLRRGRVAYERMQAELHAPGALLGSSMVMWGDLAPHNRTLWQNVAEAAFEEGRAYERETITTHCGAPEVGQDAIGEACHVILALCCSAAGLATGQIDRWEAAAIKAEEWVAKYIDGSEVTS